jgi:nucleotide-binding universal stress UspA family protein
VDEEEGGERVLVRPTVSEGAVFQSILCPTDFSESADHALALGVAWAERQHASLEIVHAMDAESERDVHHVRRVAHRLHERTERAQQRVPSARGETVIGSPRDVIAHRAAQMQKGLVVMGTERNGLLARDVLREPTPVLLVPIDVRRAMAVPHGLVAPTDSRLDTRTAVSRTLALAAEIGATVDLVEGYDPPSSVGWESTEAADLRGALGSVARERHLPESKRLNVKARVHVEEGSPVDMLGTVADEAHADMIVVGPRGHGPLWTGTGEGLIERLLDRAHVPVLVLSGLV